MALIFSSSIRNLTVARGIRDGFSSPFAITIYAGTQPLVADVLASWASYNSTSPNYLAHFTGAAVTTPSDGILCQLSTIPPAVTAANTGTATWCILWSTNLAASSLGTSTIPSANFLIGPVSVSTGSGIIRFVSTSLTSGQTATIADGSIGASLA